jgi:hypothetical protein
MSASGIVSILCVKLVPGPLVTVCTMFPATNRSAALVVVTELEVLERPLPEEAAVTSRGLTVSIPLYSKILMSANCAAGEKVTLTAFPAAAVAMFLA